MSCKIICSSKGSDLGGRTEILILWVTDDLWKQIWDRLHCDSIPELHWNVSEKMGNSEAHISREHLVIQQILKLHIDKLTLEIRKAWNIIRRLRDGLTRREYILRLHLLPMLWKSLLCPVCSANDQLWFNTLPYLRPLCARHTLSKTNQGRSKH